MHDVESNEGTELDIPVEHMKDVGGHCARIPKYSGLIDDEGPGGTLRTTPSLCESKVVIVGGSWERRTMRKQRIPQDSPLGSEHGRAITRTAKVGVVVRTKIDVAKVKIGEVRNGAIHKEM
jgi:hypothetical protein